MSEIPPPTVPPATPPPPGGGSYTPPPPPGGSYTPPPPPPPGSTAGPGGDRTIMLILSYLGIFALIPLLTKKDDPEVQWHAKNGLALAIVWVVIAIVLAILNFALAMAHIGVLGCGVSSIACIIHCALLIVDIIAMVKAIGGQRFRIPVVTDLSEKM
jgi:uncharacterized membrane protein